MQRIKPVVFIVFAGVLPLLHFLDIGKNQLTDFQPLTHLKLRVLLRSERERSWFFGTFMWFLQKMSYEFYKAKADSSPI